MRPDDQGRRYLDRVAKKLVEMAADGDSAAIKELGDRIDGKAIAHVEQNTNVTVSMEQQEQTAKEFGDIINQMAKRAKADLDKGTMH